MSLKRLARAVCPPVLLNWARRHWGGGIRFSGAYPDWEAASAAASGYDRPAILERVTEATRSVIDGKAAFERDSVLFHEPDYPFPLLSALLRAAAGNHGELKVVDFGGALGSSYRQCRPFLPEALRVRWHVIEQRHFVERGREAFTTHELSFHEDMSGVPELGSGVIVLMSSVLQYLEDPLETVRQFQQLTPHDPLYFLIDRTPMADLARDRMVVQTVPQSIYGASYACRIIARKSLLELFPSPWRCVAEFPALDGPCETDDGFAFAFRGMLFERQSRSTTGDNPA